MVLLIAQDGGCVVFEIPVIIKVTVCTMQLRMRVWSSGRSFGLDFQ